MTSSRACRCSRSPVFALESRLQGGSLKTLLCCDLTQEPLAMLWIAGTSFAGVVVSSALLYLLF
jgi:hypothetical protein